MKKLKEGMQTKYFTKREEPSLDESRLEEQKEPVTESSHGSANLAELDLIQQDAAALTLMQFMKKVQQNIPEGE